jgi:hypothetical protein
LWKEIRELWEKTSNEGEESSKAIYHCVMGVRDAFARSVSPCGSCIHIMSQLILQCLAYARLEDIYVAGFVLYTGTEEMDRRAVGVFAGSQIILDLVNEKETDLKELVDYLTMVIK